MVPQKRKPRDIVKKANKLIEDGRYTLAVNQQKLLYIIISLVRENEDIYTIPIKMLKKELNLKGESIYRDLDYLVEGIKKPFRLKKKTSYLWIDWVASIEYFRGEGRIEFEVSEKLKPYILGLHKRYTPLQIKIIMRFSSKYTIRLYELLMQYRKIGERKFTVKGLREILETKDKYQRYHDFKKRVILRAQEELEEKSDIAFDFVEIKQNKKVVAINFIIKSNATKKIGKDLNIASMSGKQQELYNGLIEDYTLSKKQAFSVIQSYSEEYISRVLQYVATQVKLDKVKNIGAYTSSAISEGWGSKQSRLVSNQEEEKQRRKREKEEKEEKFKRQTKDGKKIYESMPTDEQEDIVEEIALDSNDVFIRSKLDMFGFENSPQSVKEYIYREIHKIKE